MKDTDIARGDFNNWRWQLQNALTFSDISSHYSNKELSDIKAVDQIFPSFTTQYYYNLIELDNIPDDPIFRQVFPDICELRNNPETAFFENEDPLNEEGQMPVPHLIHRYQDRAVLLTTNRCAVHCRFCLRKRKWKKGVACHTITDNELSAVCVYLAKHPEIDEVLISGGDPLLLETASLKEILLRISQIPSVSILRVGTRVPTVLPMRIDDELSEMLSNVPGLWIATHFNHPAELTPEALNACGKLIISGIPVINQSVLMKGINDNTAVLKKLFSGLAANKIKPHYLFHIDPVKGNAHFATGIDSGLKIIEELRNQLSSLATPTFAIDLPEGGGKIPLQPDYRVGEGYKTIDGRVIEYF